MYFFFAILGCKCPNVPKTCSNFFLGFLKQVPVLFEADFVARVIFEKRFILGENVCLDSSDSVILGVG